MTVEILRGVPDWSLADERFSRCNHCGSRLIRESNHRCTCEDCQVTYTPGHTSVEYDTCFAVVVRV